MAEAIDIDVSAQLREAIEGLPCDALSIPKPSPLEIRLPTGGGSLKAFTDLSKGIPNDCAMTFNLLVQLAPLLASMDCLLKILKLLEPLAKVVTGVAKVPPQPPAEELAKLPQAVIDLAPCFGIFASIPMFAKDILCLVRAVLRCLLQQLKAVRDLMAGLALRLEAAEGNADLMATLKCAQENAQAAGQNTAQAIEPISAFLGILSPILGIAGLPSLELEMPSAPPEDVEALDAIIDTLQAVVDAIDEITGGIC
jgi:hypothetical protein